MYEYRLAFKLAPPLYLRLAHKRESPLSLVGTQVWGAAPLLCEFVLHCGGLLRGKGVVELGSGTGIVSVVAALHAEARWIVATDCSRRVLTLCARNLKLNGGCIVGVAVGLS